MIDVFISYSSKDKSVADAVCHVLEENKIACWISPRDVIAGGGICGSDCSCNKGMLCIGPYFFEICE